METLAEGSAEASVQPTYDGGKVQGVLSKDHQKRNKYATDTQIIC
jgi:hypothetical protein